MRLPFTTLACLAVLLAAVVVFGRATEAGGPLPTGALLTPLRSTDAPPHGERAAAPGTDAAPAELVDVPTREAAAGSIGALDDEAGLPGAGDAPTPSPPGRLHGWAAYDPRCERNAALRASTLPLALASVRAPDTAPGMRFAFALSIATAEAFTELDERRESEYVPDDDGFHPLPTRHGHHAIACGGANYLFAEGRFPLYDALFALEDRLADSRTLAAWSEACPLEADVVAAYERTMARLAPYR